MAGLDELPRRVAAASTDLVDAAATLPARAAALVLEHADPPRATGALARTGRVEADAATFGGGPVDYAGPVHAANPFLDRAAVAAEDAVAALLEADTDAALSLI